MDHKIDFSEPLLDFPPPPASFEDSFLSSAGAALLPELQSEAPFDTTEFASALGLSSMSTQLLFAFEKPEHFSSGFDANLLSVWKQEEAGLASALEAEKKQADLVWDSSVFARNPESIELDLREKKMSLETIVPFRLLSFGPIQKEGTPHQTGLYMYITQGLACLYGQEFWCGFAHPMPSLVWFFLRLASYEKAHAPWIRSFQMMGADHSLSLGDPREWWLAYLPVPLFGFMQEAFRAFQKNTKHTKQEAQNPGASPLALLFLSRAELLYTAHFGIPSFFEYLSNREISYLNDLKRVIQP